MHAHKIRKSIEKKAKNQLQIESEISFLDHDNNIPILKGSVNHLSYHLSDHLIGQLKWKYGSQAFRKRVDNVFKRFGHFCTFK